MQDSKKLDEIRRLYSEFLTIAVDVEKKHQFQEFNIETKEFQVVNISNPLVRQEFRFLAIVLLCYALNPRFKKDFASRVEDLENFRDFVRSRRFDSIKIFCERGIVKRSWSLEENENNDPYFLNVRLAVTNEKKLYEIYLDYLKRIEAVVMSLHFSEIKKPMEPVEPPHWWKNKTFLCLAAMIEGAYVAFLFSTPGNNLSIILSIISGILASSLWMDVSLWAAESEWGKKIKKNLPQTVVGPLYVAYLAAVLAAPALALTFVPVLNHYFTPSSSETSIHQVVLFASFISIIAMIGGLVTWMEQKYGDQYRQKVGKMAPVLLGMLFTGTLIGVPLVFHLMPILLGMFSSLPTIQFHPEKAYAMIYAVTVLIIAALGGLLTGWRCLKNYQNGGEYQFFYHPRLEQLQGSAEASLSDNKANLI